MQLVLTLPGLLTARDPSGPPLQSPSLAQLLAGSGAPVVAGDDLAEALAPHYGIERQGDWPLAAIRLSNLDVEVRDAYWLIADPVTLAVGRDDVRLEGVVYDLTRAEVDSLIATLNLHFGGDGLAFIAPLPGAIFVRAASRTRITTHPPSAAIARPLSALLPEGPDSGAWRRWQSEAQMLLHEHPVNAAREAAGRPAVNSLWFWAGGTLPRHPDAGRRIRTYANGGIAVPLASHAGSPAHGLTADLDIAIAGAAPGDVVVVALDPPLAGSVLERAWALPARAALASGRIESLSLLADGAGRAVSWRALRPGLWERIAGRFAKHDLSALLSAASEND